MACQAIKHKIVQNNVGKNNEKLFIFLYEKSNSKPKTDGSLRKNELFLNETQDKFIKNKTLGCEKCKSLELIMSVYSPCHCIKKNGLQDQCSRKCCRGSKLCTEAPKPKCCPSKFPAKYMNITYGARKEIDLNQKLSYAFYKY